MHRIRFVFVLAAALALTGCVPLEAPPEPAAEPTFTPVFASDEEALAAAEEAYAEYLRVLAVILAEGGAGPERIDAVVGDALAVTEKAGFEEFRSLGLHAVGIPVIRNATVQRYDSHEVVVYLCSDLSGVQVLDAEGRLVVGERERPASTFEVLFEFTTDQRLIVASREIWPGGGVC